MDLAALGVHHDGDGEALLVVEAAHGSDDAPVPLLGAVAHVDAGDVHPADGEGLELLRGARGGPDGADQLGAARAAEAVLLQLRLRHRVDVDARRGGGGGDGGGGAVVGGGAAEERAAGEGGEAEAEAGGGWTEEERGGGEEGADGGWRSEEI